MPSTTPVIWTVLPAYFFCSSAGLPNHSYHQLVGSIVRSGSVPDCFVLLGFLSRIVTDKLCSLCCSPSTVSPFILAVRLETMRILATDLLSMPDGLSK